MTLVAGPRVWNVILIALQMGYSHQGMYRFRRLPFGVTASPSVLNMALSSYLSSHASPIANEIANNLYVDNIMMLAGTTEEALSKYRQSKELFAKIGMNLREYVSNSFEVNLRIPEVDRLESDRMKILGVSYNIANDVFRVETNFQPMERLTKRIIVSQINSVYDPIGLAGPLLVHLKSMMREVFELGVDWKTHLNPTVCQRWNRLCSEVNNACIEVSRPLHSSDHKRAILKRVNKLGRNLCRTQRENGGRHRPFTFLKSTKSVTSTSPCRENSKKLDRSYKQKSFVNNSTDYCIQFFNDCGHHISRHRSS
ncbi:hypothetical protein OSTOST_00820 [Ostertagia ostertagi]